ncbi:hypothetical protein AB0M68_37200 [Streptomyces sp. NPDC051453]|uniref:hypothetical protein n=1 Tax=Streptomyces sp. NPDC051453 TaxID=3154941 RepID=UPI00343D327D
MPETPIRWMPDERSARILAAFASHRERPAFVHRRALELLAQADGILDSRGRVRPAAEKRTT